MKPMLISTRQTRQNKAQPRVQHNGTRSIWTHAVWGCLLGLSMALLVWAPASWLAWGVTQASQEQVKWRDVRGTVWSGSAQLVLSGGKGTLDAQALPGRLQWTLLPHWNGLRLSLQADCCMTQASSIQVRLGWSTQHIQVSDNTSQWPAALLAGLGAPWNTLQADGQLQLRTESLQLHWAEGRMQMKGLAELRMQSMSSRLSPIKPIGSYQLQLRGTPEGTATPSLQLSTRQGPLLMTGEGQWVGARLRFTGEAHAQEGYESALNNLLNILGRRQGLSTRLSLG